MKSVFVFFLLFLVFACAKDNTIPNYLPGKWSDSGRRITFSATDDYNIKYLLKGSGADTVTTDSIWGTYSYDGSRKSISFIINGIKYNQKKSNGQDSIANVQYNGTTWNISFDSPTHMRYESATSIGYLDKEP